LIEADLLSDSQRPEALTAMKTNSPLDSATSWMRAGAVSGCAVWSLLLGACGQSSGAALHNLGDTDAPLAVDAAPKVTDLAGSWVGEAEDPLGASVNGAPAVYHFPSGATQIHLDFNVATKQRLRSETKGTLYFGADDPPPPPSNFDIGYPEGVDYNQSALSAAPTLPPVEGFRYTLFAQIGTMLEDIQWLTDADVSDGVFRLSLTQNEVFEDWCAAQPNVPLLDGKTYTCLGTQGYLWGNDGPCEMVRPGLPARGVNSDDVPVDCGKLFLCEVSTTPICRCDSMRCYVNQDNHYGLFLRRQGEELVGSFAQTPLLDANGAPTSVGTVRFHRAD
jgi:hypothetical protein